MPHLSGGCSSFPLIQDEIKCKKNKIKYLKLSKKNYNFSGSINPKFSSDGQHITDIDLIKEIHKIILKGLQDLLIKC